MNARQHLEKLVAAAQSGNPLALGDVTHAAANFLAVPELTPAQFQKDLCTRLKARADSAMLPVKGVKRHRAYIEGMAGACMALESVDPALASSTMFVFIMLCARDATVVDNLAEENPL